MYIFVINLDIKSKHLDYFDINHMNVSGKILTIVIPIVVLVVM